MKISTDTITRIWNDDTGQRMEVGEDADGLGLVEIRSIDANGNVEARMTFPAGYVAELIRALENRRLI